MERVRISRWIMKLEGYIECSRQKNSLIFLYCFLFIGIAWRGIAGKDKAENALEKRLVAVLEACQHHGPR